jgi:hypothetical protein
MARRARRQNGEGEGTDNVTPIRSNGLDPAVTTALLDRILNLYGSLDGERSDYMNACKIIRSDMAEIYKEADNKGVPKRGLKAAVKRRLLEHKIDNIRADMEDSQDVDDYDMVLQALGGLAELPLGAAALAAHPSGPQIVA